MLTTIEIRRGPMWTRIRDVEDINIPIICTTCGEQDTAAIVELVASPYIECPSCFDHMVICNQEELTNDRTINTSKH